MFLSLLGLLCLATGWVQQKSISGTISDENGLPLPGATVVIQNTTVGTTTDFDGNFSLEASAGDVLEISYVGYQNATLTVGEADAYSLSLQLGNELAEVVVTSQYWIAMYNRGFEGWYVYRKFDGPKLNVAANSQLPVPKRYTYPIDEQSLNAGNWSAASNNGASDLQQTPIFWDK